MLEIAVNWHTPTVGIEPTASPPSRSTVRRTNHCATAPFPKRMVWTQLILCAVYRDTVLSPDVTTVTAQHCSPLRRRCSCSRTACICNRLETPTWFREPYPWRRYCVSRRCHQCWKIAVNWHTPTVGIKPTAPPPSRSTVRRTNHCATAPFPKRMVWTQLILCAVYRDTVLSPDVTTVTAQQLLTGLLKFACELLILSFVLSSIIVIYLADMLKIKKLIFARQF